MKMLFVYKQPKKLLIYEKEIVLRFETFNVKQFDRISSWQKYAFDYLFKSSNNLD